MSNVAQGPGWWQGTDGKWYPPEVQPAPADITQAGVLSGGTAQAAFCRNCGAAGEPGFPFCASCGSALALSGPGPGISSAPSTSLQGSPPSPPPVAVRSPGTAPQSSSRGRRVALVVVAAIILVVVVAIGVAIGSQHSSNGNLTGDSGASSTCNEPVLGCFSGTIRSLQVTGPQSATVKVTIFNNSAPDTPNALPMCNLFIGNGDAGADARTSLGVIDGLSDHLLPSIPPGQSWTGVIHYKGGSFQGGSLQSDVTGATLGGSSIKC